MKRGRVPSLSVSRQFYGAIRPKLQPSVYYRKLAGNIPDVKTMRVLLRDLDVLGYPKVKLVTDISASTSLSFVKRAIESAKETIFDRSHYNDKYDLYTCTLAIEWEYVQVRPNKGDTLKESRRMYLHLYYSAEKAVEDGRKFNLRMIALQQELISGKRRAEHEKDYEKYFEVKLTPLRGINLIHFLTIIQDKSKIKTYNHLIL